MSTVLVTGASGFVGSHLLPELLGAGHRVVALVRSSGAGDKVTRRLPAALVAKVELRTGDVDRPATLPAALAGVDAVVHLVAIPRDRKGGKQLLAVNLDGTRNVIAAMQATGIRCLVHLGAMGVEDREELHYAKSKARAERAVRESALDWTILKPSLLFGPGDGFFNIVADLVRLSPGFVPVPGDGKSRFQALHGEAQAQRQVGHVERLEAGLAVPRHRDEPGREADQVGDDVEEAVSRTEEQRRLEDRPVEAALPNGPLGPCLRLRVVELLAILHAHRAEVDETPDAGSLDRGEHVSRAVQVDREELLAALPVARDRDEVHHRVA